jgi:hypothetical protein
MSPSAEPIINTRVIAIAGQSNIRAPGRSRRTVTKRDDEIAVSLLHLKA